MHKIDVKFEDLNGVDTHEEFYFHLNEEEIVAMEIEVDGGLAGHWQRIIDSTNNRNIYREFKKILEMSYGQKSDDGRRFIKNAHTQEYLLSHVAFPKLVMMLISDEEAAAAFVQNIIPDFREMVMIKAADERERRKPQDRLRKQDRPPRGSRIIEGDEPQRGIQDVELPNEDVVDGDRPGYFRNRPVREYTPAEIQDMTANEYIDFMLAVRHSNES